MKIKQMIEKLKKRFSKNNESLTENMSIEDISEKWSKSDIKNKIKIALMVVKRHKSYFICGIFAGVILVTVGILNLKSGILSGDKEMVNAEEMMTVSSSSTSTTYADISAEATTAGQILCHYNTDGKLYGKKGTFSGLWPELEKAAKASKEQYIKDLMVYVGDNTELEKSKYEEDKFTQINGYGTVHWRQVGHKWPNKYSCAYGDVEPSNSDSLFRNIKKEEKIEEITGSITGHTQQNDVLEIMPEIVLSDGAVATEEPIETTEAVEETKESTTKDNTNKKSNDEKKNTEKTTELQTANAIVESSGLAPGKVWGGNSCGVCSLAMALSTLSGVTVSPPEVALAANLLIGKSAWYQVIIYSKSQAKLAQLAGFPVYMEPWNEAKKSTMDACLNANGVALFVSKGSSWVDFGGRHYIMVRNKVGDKYYTADSGKNPTGGFTYEQLSSGYCQQYIVYIYPKSINQNNNTEATTVQNVTKLNK